MISRRSFGLLAAALTATVAAPRLSWADDAGEMAQAQALVQAIATRGIQEVVAAPLPQAEKIERFRTIFTSYFDLPAAARFVLGAAWRTASPEQQEEFVSLFQDVNIYTWARRFKDYTGQSLVVMAAVPDGANGAYVESKVEQGANQAPLNVRWRLRKRPDTEYKFLVVDLEIEGISMALTYRADYAAEVQNGGGNLAPLLGKMRQQVERLKAEQPT